MSRGKIYMGHQCRRSFCLCRMETCPFYRCRIHYHGEFDNHVYLLGVSNPGFQVPALGQRYQYQFPARIGVMVWFRGDGVPPLEIWIAESQY